jgi:hypothetical protein
MVVREWSAGKGVRWSPDRFFVEVSCDRHAPARNRDKALVCIFPLEIPSFVAH